MIEKLALQLTSFICTEAYDNPIDRAKIQYGLSVILSEGIKFIFLITLFSIIHLQKYFYFSLIILLSIRTFAGGVHVKGTLNCLLLTTLLFIFTSVLAPLMPAFNKADYLAIGLCGLAIFLVRAPICGTGRTIKSNKKKLHYKFISSTALSIWIVALLLLKDTHYINCGFSTILAQSIQLVLIKKQNHNKLKYLYFIRRSL